MDGAALVDEARSYLDCLVRSESGGPGDVANAIRRIARRERIAPGALWSLRYRPPKDIYASVLFKLRSAYADACERQLQHLERELTAAKAAGLGEADLRSATAVVAAARAVTE